MIIERRIEKFNRKRIELEEGEVLKGAENATIFLNKGVELKGKFQGCTIEPQKFPNNEIKLIKLDQIFEYDEEDKIKLSGDFIECDFNNNFLPHVVISGSLIDCNINNSFNRPEFRPKEIIFSNQPRQEGGNLTAGSLNVLARTALKVSFCPRLEDDFDNNESIFASRCIYSPLTIKEGEKKIKFLLRTYSAEAKKTRLEIGAPNSGDIVSKFGLIPRFAYQFQGEIPDEMHNYLSPHVIYSPSGQKERWHDLLVRFQNEHNRFRYRDYNSKLLLNEEMEIEEEGLTICPVKILRINNLKDVDTRPELRQFF